MYPRGRIPVREVLSRVQGYMVIQSPDGRGAHINNLNGDEITAVRLKDYLEQTMIAQSGVDVTIEELEWTFYPNRTLYNVGGSGVAKPKYTTNLYKLCYQEYADEQGPIGCAAFALNYRIYYKEKKYAKKPLAEIIRDARAFQN